MFITRLLTFSEGYGSLHDQYITSDAGKQASDCLFRQDVDGAVQWLALHLRREAQRSDVGCKRALGGYRKCVLEVAPGEMMRVLFPFERLETPFDLFKLQVYQPCHQ